MTRKHHGVNFPLPGLLVYAPRARACTGTGEPPVFVREKTEVTCLRKSKLPATSTGEILHQLHLLLPYPWIPEKKDQNRKSNKYIE